MNVDTIQNISTCMRRKTKKTLVGKMNIGLQVGLTHKPISTTTFQKLCLSCNISWPTTTRMKYMPNKVVEKIQEANEEDRRQQQQELSEIDRLRGNNPKVTTFRQTAIIITHYTRV